VLDAAQLVALLCPPRERPRLGRWLLVAASIHAAVIALLVAMPRPPASETVLLVQLLPVVAEPVAGSPAAATEPATPESAPARLAAARRAAATTKPRPRIATEPVPAPPPLATTLAPARPAATSEAAPAGGDTATRGSEHAAMNGARGRNGASSVHGHGLAGLDPAYARRLLASLERHKHYPRSARARRLEGVTLLWIRMDRSGRVLSSRISESSGHRVLDHAVLATVRKASPLPALPASDARAELELIVPIAFRMR